MANRFQTVTFTRTIAASSSASFGVTVPNNIINIAKIRVAPSIAAAPTEFFLYKNSTYAAADLVYATKQFTGPLVDPVEDTGALVLERNEGYVAAFEDENESLQIYIKINNNHSASVTYTGTIIVDTAYDHTGSTGIILGVPEGLMAKAYATDLDVVLGVIASKNIATIDTGELRAQFVAQGAILQSSYDFRTVAEGGTFVPDGINFLEVTGLDANDTGCQYIFTSAAPGTWFYAWRLHNSVGFSNWTDGNLTPRRVTQSVSTRDNNTPDIGPPADWDLTIEDGPASSTVVVRASRPKTNGDIINFLAVQIKDGDTGSWTSVLNGPDPDNLKWDGTAVPLTINASKNQLTDAGASNFGTAAVGDVVLFDVRGAGNWDEAYCQWATVRAKTATRLTIDGFFRPVTGASDFRVMIFKPPWTWTTGGYLGGYAGGGMWPQWWESKLKLLLVGDTKTVEFVTTPIVIPAAVTNPEARAWFENNYSRSDDSVNHTTGMIGLPTARLWTSFSDKRWFIPMYGLPAFAQTTINADGTVTLNAPNPRPAGSNAGSFWGIKSRFSVFPDATGILILRARFTNVQLPQYTTEGNATLEATGLYIASFLPWGFWNGFMTNGIFWGNYRNNADIRFGQGYWAQGTASVQQFIPQVGAGTGSTGYTDVARPASGYTLDLRVGWGPAVGAGANPENAMVTCEYSLNGGAYVALADIAKGLANEYGNLFVEGICPTFGVAEANQNAGKALSNWSCNITEFEVVQGIIRQYRLQSTR